MGVHRGYSGLLNGEMFPMNRSSVSDIIQRGGTILRTARCEEFKKDENYESEIKELNLKVNKLENINSEDRLQAVMHRKIIR